MATPDASTPRADDRVLRALTADNAFRIIVARTTHTVRDTLATQSAPGEMARHFGDLLTGTILVRETMAPQLRVQGLLKGANRSWNMVADSRPDGGTRGLVTAAEDTTEPFHFGDGTTLQLMRTLANGALHQGVVEALDEGGLSGALMAYMQLSEQVVSVIGVATSFGDGVVQLAGGYIVQLLPEAEGESIQRMIDRLSGVDATDVLLARTAGDPHALVRELVGDDSYATLEESTVEFSCGCNEVRLMGTLSTLPRTDIEELLRDGEVLEMGCDFCGKQYRVHPAQLRGLLETS